MTERDPIQRVMDGVMLTDDAYQKGQLDALRKTLRSCETLRSFEALTEDLKQRIRDIEARRR